MASDPRDTQKVSRRTWLKTIGLTAASTTAVTQTTEAQEDSGIAWPQIGGDRGRTYYHSTPVAPEENAELHWEVPTSDGPTPIFVNGKTYAMLDDGFVLSIGNSGRPVKQLYKMPADTSGLLYNEGRLHVIDDQNTAVALDAETGREIWRRTFPNPIQQPVAARGALFYGTINNNIVKVAPSSGEIISEFGNPFEYATENASSVVTDGSTIYANSPESGLFARNVDNGELQWQTEIDGGAGTPAVTDGTVYAPSANSSTQTDIVSLNASSGELNWTTTIETEYPANIVVGQQRVFAGWSRLFGLNRETGEIDWGSGLRPRAMTGAGNTLYVITQNENEEPGPFVAVDMASGLERWRYSFQVNVETVESPAITDNGVVIGYGNRQLMFTSGE